MKSMKNSLTTFTRTLKGAIMQYFKYDKVQIVKDVYDDKQEINWKSCVGFIVDISSRNDEYPIEVTLTKNS